MTTAAVNPALTYANQASELMARANAADVSTREVEKLFLAMIDTTFTDQHETLLKLTTMHDNGILSNTDLRHTLKTLCEYYQKRRIYLETALHNAIDEIMSQKLTQHPVNS
jgi:hypothetical protein